MPKYQLTISPDYVADWTYLEAVRELFQNALDNETVNTENSMFFSYTDGVLQIGNKTSILPLDSLLLGTSTKRNEVKTIGKHGEGYKVAFMTLLREGKEVTVYNYGAKEIWKTRLVKSRKFNGALITEIDVQKKAIFQKVPSHHLIFEVKGISEEEYKNIVKHNLHLQDNIEKIVTQEDMGYILTSPENKGKIFVNGLYITTNDKFNYGYNIPPKYINLDRDRKLVDTFNLSWTTSRMWRYSNQEDIIATLMYKDALDVRYVKDSKYPKVYELEGELDDKITENLLKVYSEEHGEGTYPVATNEDLRKFDTHATHIKPVIVPTSVSAYLEHRFNAPAFLTVTPKERLTNWFDTVQDKLSEEEQEDFKAILEDLR